MTPPTAAVLAYCRAHAKPDGRCPGGNRVAAALGLQRRDVVAAVSLLVRRGELVWFRGGHRLPGKGAAA